jgi:hypothetical protein
MVHIDSAISLSVTMTRRHDGISERTGLGSTDFTGCGKTQSAVILSEAKNLSWFFFLYLNRREILRFAQNDKTRHFFRSLFSLRVFA